jgi:hypothetical protein
MKQVIYAPGFLMRYQQWRIKDRSLESVDDAEFTALVLRICAYAAQFLPSPSHTVDGDLLAVPLSHPRHLQLCG